MVDQKLEEQFDAVKRGKPVKVAKEEKPEEPEAPKVEVKAEPKKPRFEYDLWPHAKLMRLAIKRRVPGAINRPRIGLLSALHAQDLKGTKV